MGNKTIWNYRVCREKIDSETYDYTVREVYYKGGKVVGYSADAVAPSGETARELVKDLKRMAKSIDKGVLDLETLEVVRSE